MRSITIVKFDLNRYAFSKPLRDSHYMWCTALGQISPTEYLVTEKDNHIYSLFTNSLNQLEISNIGKLKNPIHYLSPISIPTTKSESKTQESLMYSNQAEIDMFKEALPECIFSDRIHLFCTLQGELGLIVPISE